MTDELLIRVLTWWKSTETVFVIMHGWLRGRIEPRFWSTFHASGPSRTSMKGMLLEVALSKHCGQMHPLRREGRPLLYG